MKGLLLILSLPPQGSCTDWELLSQDCLRVSRVLNTTGHISSRCPSKDIHPVSKDTKNTSSIFRKAHFPVSIPRVRRCHPGNKEMARRLTEGLPCLPQSCLPLSIGQSAQQERHPDRRPVQFFPSGFLAAGTPFLFPSKWLLCSSPCSEDLCPPNYQLPNLK